MGIDYLKQYFNRGIVGDAPRPDTLQYLLSIPWCFSAAPWDWSRGNPLVLQEAVMITTVPRNSPLIDLIIIAVGILLFIFRDAIGSATGYSYKGHYIDKPTPGCLLIPFALVMIIGGSILLIRYFLGS